MEDSPCVSTKDCDWSKCIPLCFHGDEADAHRRRSFCVTTLSSAVVGGDPWNSKLLLYVTDCNKAIPETYDVLDAWRVWSLIELQEGTFLDVDPFGRKFARGLSGPVAGPWRAFFKGDEKFCQRALKLVQSWVSHGVCAFCKATQTGDLVYTTYGPKAAHHGTLLSNEDFLLHGMKNNPWCRLPGFHVQCVTLDWLHLVDLAVLPECAASVT